MLAILVLTRLQLEYKLVLDNLWEFLKVFYVVQCNFEKDLEGIVIKNDRMAADIFEHRIDKLELFEMLAIDLSTLQVLNGCDCGRPFAAEHHADLAKVAAFINDAALRELWPVIKLISDCNTAWTFRNEVDAVFSFIGNIVLLTDCDIRRF